MAVNVIDEHNHYTYEGSHNNRLMRSITVQSNRSHSYKCVVTDLNIHAFNYSVFIKFIKYIKLINV